jgi:hypothetical protein
VEEAPVVLQQLPAHLLNPVLPAHISCMPPGFHYFAMNGMAYFLNLMTSKKVKLGSVKSSILTPIDLHATSFVTPSVQKESKAKRDLMVLSESIGDNEEVVYVLLRVCQNAQRHFEAIVPFALIHLCSCHVGFFLSGWANKICIYNVGQAN